MTTQRPAGTDLGNWRIRPYSAWSFQNVRELVPSANISAGQPGVISAQSEAFANPKIEGINLVAELESLESDSLTILRGGEKIWQWNTPHCDLQKPHIVFSISKSITAMMAGCLWGQGLIDLEKPVSFYLEGTKGSGYESCTVQQLLDMTVALQFEEDYLNPGGDYFRYRNATCWNPVDQTADAPSLEMFLYSLGKADHEHGEVFSYKSPNSDLLGLLIERTAGVPYAALLSELIWRPMGAERDGYVTVDRNFLARGAGGICVTADDLARFGQLVLDRGARGTQSVIPEAWIADTISNGNRDAWLKGDFSALLPQGQYRNKWYQIGDADGCFMGLGIHGQWLFVNPTTETVIVKLSWQSAPVDDVLDARTLQLLMMLGRCDSAQLNSQ